MNVRSRDNTSIVTAEEQQRDLLAVRQRLETAHMLIPADIVDRVPNLMDDRSSDGMKWEWFHMSPGKWQEVPDLNDSATCGVLHAYLLNEFSRVVVGRTEDKTTIQWGDDPDRCGSLSADTYGIALARALLISEVSPEE